MSFYEGQQKKHDFVQGNTVQQKAKNTALPRFLLPHIQGSVKLLRQIGNAAIKKLFGERGGGQPLDSKIRKEMEHTFGTDFEDVRLHRDAETQSVADALHAKAFTSGKDVYLSADAPSPETTAGKKLLAHELAHVVQQRQAGKVKPDQVSNSSDVFETQANHMAKIANTGQPVQLSTVGTPPAVQRQEDERGFVEQQLGNLIDRALQDGIAFDSNKGLKVGGVAVRDVERGIEVFERILDGDFQGALEELGLRDPADKERRREEMRKLRNEILQFQDQLKTPEQKQQEREAIERLLRPRLRLPQPESRFRLRKPTLDPKALGLRPGTTEKIIIDSFRLESADLESHHRQQLDNLANRIISRPNAELEIVGHADTTGPQAFNQSLSERRAKAVRDYLISRGVEVGKIKAVTGRGEEAPLVAERSDADHARNRRVEIFFTTGVTRRSKSPFGIPPLHLGE